MLDITETIAGITTTYFVTIAEGNYNCYEYAKEVMSLINKASIQYEIRYNKIQNKFTFQIITPNCLSTFLFGTGTHIDNNCREFLGFDADDVHLTDEVIIDSDNCVVMNNIYYLQLKSDLGNHMVMSDNSDNIFEIIPISPSPYSFITYNPVEINKYLTNEKQIAHINITLLDNHGDDLNLNNIPFYLTIKLEVVSNDSFNIPYSKGGREEKTNLEMLTEDPDIIDKAQPQEQITLNDKKEFDQAQEEEKQKMSIHELIDLRNLENMLKVIKKQKK
jgi:hypothetical protein